MIIAQISDPHIQLDYEPAVTQLQRAIEHLLQLPTRPDVVMITGDCTNNGTVAEYELFREAIGALPMPTFVIPGNHDNREHMLAVIGEQGQAQLPGYMQYVVDVGPLRLIALDTNIPGQGGGAQDPEQLEWLAQRLEEAPDRPTLIFMHHPPFRTGFRAYDQIGLADAEAFGALIARHPQIELIGAGHVHATMVRRFYGTLALTCPAIYEQMLPDESQRERLVVQKQPPQCFLHIWDEQSGLTSYASQIGQHGPSVTVFDGQRWVG